MIDVHTSAFQPRVIPVIPTQEIVVPVPDAGAVTDADTDTDTDTKPYVDFYAGERLAMGSTVIGSAPSRVSTYGAVATGLPIASTPVASRSPVIQLMLVARSAVPG